MINRELVQDFLTGGGIIGSFAGNEIAIRSRAQLLDRIGEHALHLAKLPGVALVTCQVLLRRRIMSEMIELVGGKSSGVEILGPGNSTAQAQESFECPVRPVSLGRRNLFVGVTKTDVFPLIRFDCPGSSLFGINEFSDGNGWILEHG